MPDNSSASPDPATPPSASPDPATPPSASPDPATPPKGAWDLIAVPWHLDEHIPDFPVPVGTAAIISPPLPKKGGGEAGAVPGRMTVLHRAIADAVTESGRPLLLSGDCPTSLAVVADLQRRHREMAVVWLDAHGDFNTPAITVSGYLGGMPLAMLAGHAPELFADPLGLRPVPEHNIVLADARDLDPAERDALAASQVRHIPATVGDLRAALSGLGDLPVYLHVDVDIMDSTEIPGLRFPTGHGPSLGEIENCLTAITADADVVAACLACAWLPEQVSSPPAREAIVRLAGALGTRLSWPPGDTPAATS